MAYAKGSHLFSVQPYLVLGRPSLLDRQLLIVCVILIARDLVVSAGDHIAGKVAPDLQRTAVGLKEGAEACAGMW